MATEEAIHPDTSMGAVHLTVRDLEGSLGFYQQRLGLTVRDRQPGTVRLGVGEADLVVLHGRPDAPRLRGTTGLYHFAILLPSRGELARMLAHFLATRMHLQGAADHLVSEALYLTDPEGNGIEVYRDRPREQWPLEDGGVRMATDPLDLDDLLGEGASAPPWPGLPAGSRIGHVHLRVSRLDEAARFYSDVLGFGRTARLGDSALFLSAGGYHHHLGLNTWAGEGAPPPPPGAAGLDHFEVALPDQAERQRVVARARAAGAAVEDTEEGPSLRDPSSNRLVLSVARSGREERCSEAAGSVRVSSERCPDAAGDVSRPASAPTSWPG